MLGKTPEEIMNWHETYAHGDNGIKWAQLIVDYKLRELEHKKLKLLVSANWVLATAAIVAIFIG